MRGTRDQLFPVRFLKRGYGLPSQGLTNPCSLQPPSKILHFVIFSINLGKLILHFRNDKLDEISSDENVVFKGFSNVLGPWEMVTGEWENSIITDGFLVGKWGHFYALVVWV